ncbi:unnamed protein product, partial [Closterium sp. NIES-54]
MQLPGFCLETVDNARRRLETVDNGGSVAAALKCNISPYAARFLPPPPPVFPPFTFFFFPSPALPPPPFPSPALPPPPFPSRISVLNTDTLGTAINADSGTATAGTATSVDATAGASASDLSALAVDTKTKQEIKALAPLIGAADLAGVDKPPKRASYLTKDAFATAVRRWIAKVKRRVQALQKQIRQAGGGGGNGRGMSTGNSARGNTTAVDPSLGYTPPPIMDPAKLPNLNTVSRYLTVGLTLDQSTQKLTWDFKRSVDHSS